MKKLFAFFSSVFFISGFSTAASITVTKPAANEAWVKGQSYTITWTKAGTMPANVKINLRNKASTTVVMEIVDPAPNTGAYLWQIPASAANGEYRIRVRVKGTDIFDDSEVFTIGSGQPGPGPGPGPKVKSEVSLVQNYAVPIKPFVTVVMPGAGAILNNGEHRFVQFDAFTMPGDALEIDLYRASGQKVVPIYYGAYGEGTSVPPAGGGHPRRYAYDWQVPYGDIMAPGDYKIRIHSLGKEIIAWSGTFHITWPMKEKEYLFEAAVTNHLCVNDTSGLDYPPRPKCEDLYHPDHAYAGYDVFDHAGTIKWTDGEVHSYWRTYIHHARLKFPIEQFQGKKVNVVSAWLDIKKECTVNVNTGQASCAGRIYRLEAPFPTGGSGAACLNIAKTAVLILPDNLSEESYYVKDTLEHWIDGTFPNHGFMLTVANETPPPTVTAACISGYSVKLRLKIEEEYKGYE